MRSTVALANLMLCLSSLLCCSGCGAFTQSVPGCADRQCLSSDGPGAMLDFDPQSPMGFIGQPTQAATVYLQAGNPDLLFDQMVDVLDDYFRIEREDRIRRVGSIITEGRIDTYPQVGATLLEPHRFDSIGWFNRLESTFQSVRRHAHVRLIPTEGGYMADVVVFKELEDVSWPEHTTAGAATFRYDAALDGESEDISGEPRSLGWIPQGRDTVLEQQIIAEIKERLQGCQR